MVPKYVEFAIGLTCRRYCWRCFIGRSQDQRTGDLHEQKFICDIFIVIELNFGLI